MPVVCTPIHRLWSQAAGRSTASIVAALILVLSVLGAAGRAHEKLFWHDEIFTLTLAALPLREQWAALLQGVDAHPPLFFAITRLCYRLVGDGHIAMRLPGMAGVMIAALSVAAFVRRR